MKKWYLLLFVISIPVLTYLSLHRALGFGFWRDDWLYVWGLEIFKNPSIFHDTNLATSYPLDLYRLELLGRILNVDPRGWQLSSLVFRTLVPFAAAFFVKAITRSTKVAIISAIFLAVGVAGLEPASFLGANNVTFIMIFIALGFYFWVSSLRFFQEQKGRLGLFTFIVAVVIFGVCAKGEVWSYYLIPLMAIAWDVLEFLQARSFAVFKITLVRCLVLIAVLFSISSLPPNPNWFARNNGMNKLKSIKITNVKNLFASLGNLVIGSVSYVPESAGSSSYSSESMFVGLTLVAGLIAFGFIYLVYPSNFKKSLVFFLAWTFFFYFPNWVFESTLVVGASHRYLTISSLGLYPIFALLLARTSRTLMWIGVLAFVVINVHNANRILGDLSVFRSQKIISGVVTAMTDPIPPDQEDVIVHYGGEGLIRGYILDWSLGIPIAMARNTAEREKFPIWTGSDDIVLKLVCGQKVTVNLVGRGETYDRGGYPIDVDHIYSFFVKDSGEVINNTDSKRSQIAHMDCDQIQPVP